MRVRAGAGPRVGAPPVSRQCNKYPEVLNRKQIADGRTDGRTAEREKEDGDATRMGIWSGDGEREGGGRREREREESAQLVSTVADSKTPLSKEVRSTSKMVNGRPGVEQAFHDLGSRSHEKINVFPVFSLHSLSTR